MVACQVLDLKFRENCFDDSMPGGSSVPAAKVLHYAADITFRGLYPLSRCQGSKRRKVDFHNVSGTARGDGLLYYTVNAPEL
jgi:hypothetical protein